MSVQDIGAVPEEPTVTGSTGSARASASRGETFAEASGAAAGRRNDWRETRDQAIDLEAAWGPWGPRPASTGAAVLILRGIDRVALPLIYVAVLAGLPAAAIAFATGLI